MPADVDPHAFFCDEGLHAVIGEVVEKAYGLTPLSGYKYCTSHKAGQCLKTKEA